MKLKRLAILGVAGIVCAGSLSFAEDCVNEPVPCIGSETINGYGCQTGCPPSNPNLGCCSYVEYRVNCDVGPDQWYRTHACSLPSNCGDPVIPKIYRCTHL
jgi:hypothetical protein